jgi:hypothetical protein
MKPEKAITILEALGAGCDPATGEMIDSESLFQRADVLAALFVAVKALKGPPEYAKFKKSKRKPKKATPPPPESEHSVITAAQKLFKVSVNGGPARFQEPGWFPVGKTSAACKDCSLEFQGFRKPYISAGRTYYYWALVCEKCGLALEPKQLDDEQRKRLYKSSEFRPGSPPEIEDDSRQKQFD